MMGLHSFKTKARVELRIKEFFRRKRLPLIYSPLHEFVIMRGGKRIRPFLCELAFKAAGGVRENAALIDAAAAIELVHNFSLMHDDIEDGSKLRRGMPCMYIEEGIPFTINAGDGLFASAFELLASSKNIKSPRLHCQVLSEFAQAIVRMCEGQALDIDWAANRGPALISPREYIRMTRLKTGSLFSACTAIGALMSGKNLSKIGLRAFRDYGTALGVAFQVRDDVLNISGSQSELGKTIGDDIVEGKKTLLLLKAFKLASRADKRILARVYSPKKRTKTTMADARQVIKIFGRHSEQIISYAKGVARQELEKSRPAFAKACRSQKFFDKFVELERFVLEERRA